ncbi:hypothetical protein FM125_03045 [Micrococcus lylae]|uniref:Uncharacterized protein n=1 Tax=Micrococcus lylae TaxID=1273 RepID=A0A1R4IKN2_9MICC|nr:hypothetical protein FM125_03045 [Micrococcus lylae]
MGQEWVRPTSTWTGRGTVSAPAYPISGLIPTADGVAEHCAGRLVRSPVNR